MSTGSQPPSQLPTLVHAFVRADASYGRAPCGVYLSRGWLNATDDRARITCPVCIAFVEAASSNADEPTE